jgi:Na+-translocating ferredoxin:NAD+ oxidoreductase subunit B
MDLTQLAAELDALLPQTQCTRCGFAGCLPYAQAMARGEADINRCPPGGAATIGALARHIGREPLPLDPGCGAEGPHRIAQIDESRCIGCAKCLPPCPVDAIVGTARHVHTVLIELCTGCELCIAPCPVDCITLVPAALLVGGPQLPAPAVNRERFAAHRERHERRERERDAFLAARKREAHAQ